MAAKPPDAFLSYTRFDDKHDGGAISEFCRRLASAVRAVTGVPFNIFQDVEGLGVGQHWPRKLDEMLNEARFFIPILTPSYFTSKPCREELAKFLRAEAERRRDDLVLPIYYIESELLEDDDLRATDLLARTLHEREREDWRELRFEPFGSGNVRKALERLAREIVKARRRPMTARQSVVPDDATAAPRQDSAGVDEPVGQPSPPPQRLSPEPLEPILQRWAALREQGKAAKLAVKGARVRQDRTPSFEPGTVFRDKDEPWCPELVVIPAGEFMMGSTEAEREWAVAQGAERQWVESERPQHLVRIAYPLAVGRYPVTFEEYGHFARSTGRAQPGDEGSGRRRRPVINVDWEDARFFIAWLSVQTGQRYRLLSEAEWEYACRAGTSTRYWWGDEITAANANYGKKVGKTSEVGKYSANPFGLYDVHGNVWERVEDCWHESYEGAPDNGGAWISGDCARRVVRGGSWNDPPRNLRCASRTGIGPEIRYYMLGFRVCRAR
jgi:formylglycine-generating enzyme required for sulfatase activity